MLAHYALDRRARERRLSAEHFVEHAAQGIQIAPTVHVVAARGLLRAHVQGRPHGHPGLGQCLAAGGVDRLGDAEVGHHRVPALEQNILGLDVTVDDPAAVRVTQRVRHLSRDLDGIVQRELLLAVQPLPQRLTLGVGHDVEEQPVGLARIVERQDVRVTEIGARCDLAEEPLRTERGGQLRAEHLDGHAPPVLQVLGEPHDGHAAMAQLASDAITIGKGSGQAVDDVGHGD